MAQDENSRNLKSELLYDYGKNLGTIEKVNISETFNEPLLLAAACFHPNTRIQMKDGSYKKIRHLIIGDEVHKGGKVYMKLESLSDNVYELEGVYVAGTHTVYEDGRWIQVSESRAALPVSGTHVIMNIGTDEHMLVTENGRVFADFYLTNKHFEIEKQLISALNQEKDQEYMQKKFAKTT